MQPFWAVRINIRGVAIGRGLMSTDILVSTDKSAAGGGMGCDCREQEIALVERARTDVQAFGELYERYYGRILNYIYRRTLSVSVAEELTSNTFFKALRGMGAYHNDGMFLAWLYGIANNEIRARWRGERARKDDLWQADLARIYSDRKEGGVTETEEKQRRFVQVRQLLMRLPQRYQTVLMMRYFEKLTLAEIGRATQTRLGTVKSLVARGLRKLREQADGIHELLDD